MFSATTLLVTARQTFWLRGQLRRHSERIQQKENNFLNERFRIVLTNSGKDSALDLKACWLQSWPCGAEPGLRLTLTVSHLASQQSPNTNYFTIKLNSPTEIWRGDINTSAKHISGTESSPAQSWVFWSPAGYKAEIWPDLRLETTEQTTDTNTEPH